MIIYTGRRLSLPDQLISAVREMLAADENANIIVLVPDQLTLETEMMLFRALGLQGSFTINVVSPKRLCSKVFEEAGKPSRATVDELGRSMIMGYLLRQHAEELRFYKKAAARTGFEARIIKEIQNLKQAGVSCESVEKLAGDGKNAKLNDISLLYRAYEERLKGHVQDGEDEIREACIRFSASSFIKGARALVYGFDLTTASQNRLIAGIAGVCPDTRVFLPLPKVSSADRNLYVPLRDACRRLHEEIAASGTEIKYADIGDAAFADGAAGLIASQLFCLRPETYAGQPDNVDVAVLKDELEEARFVAASVRKLVMERGWKYSDIRVVSYSSDTSGDALQSAFDEYEVPYFSQDGRNAGSDPLCVFLRETLRLITNKSCSVSALLGAGFADLSRAEAEELMSYMQRLDLHVSALNNPFKRGTEKMRMTAEPARQKLMKPILKLKDRLKAKISLKDQLTAVYDYLSELDCVRKSVQMRKEMLELGLKEQAAGDVQIWNRLMSTLDQLLELLGPEALNVNELSDLIQRALNAVRVKQLPLSPDCVEIASPERTGMTGVKAIILMGSVQESAPANSGVFTQQELRDVSKKLGRYITPDTAERTKTRRMYVKDSLSLAREYLLITSYSSTSDGSAVGKGAIMNEVRRILPHAGIIGENLNDGRITRTLLCARAGALDRLAGRIGADDLTDAERSAVKVLKEDGRLSEVLRAREYNWQSSPIGGDTAVKLYRGHVSITGLERFAGCPFSGFIKNGIRPEENDPYTLDARERGSFLHSCMEELTKTIKPLELSEDEAEEKMDEIADAIMADGKLKDLLGDTATAEAAVKSLKFTARRTARTLARQLKNRDFAPVALEMAFGDKGEYVIELENGEKISFRGKIDRIDKGVYNGQEYVSVIDYKSGSKEFDPGEVYLGLQLQLLIYLSVAVKYFNADSAGVYYFRIRDDYVKTVSTNADSIEDIRIKDNILKGVVPSDIELLKFMAEEPSKVYKTGLDKAGAEFTKTAVTASQDEFKRLMRHVRRRAEELTERMYSGENAIKPYRTSNGSDACKYCGYEKICFRSNFGREARAVKKQAMKMEELNAKLLEEELGYENNNAAD